MDVLAEILPSLRLTGGVVSDARLTGDFCLLAELGKAQCSPFFPVPETLIAYHYVRSGQMIVQVDGLDPATAKPGTIVLLPRNDPHLVCSRVGLPPAKISEISVVTTEGVHKIRSGSAGPVTQIWCGFLGTAKANAHPLLDALPPLLVLTAPEAEQQWLDGSLRFAAEQPLAPKALAKLAEVFLAQAIRHYLSCNPIEPGGWLRALTDPAVAKALSIIHRRYDENLTLEQLARQAGVSRTVLQKRFIQLLGQPAMRYCASWRMRSAAAMLREQRQNTASIAHAVGFHSEAAFSRAFKREFGMPPATWRRHVQSAGVPITH